eukprot:COSAG01_NODE_29750_length_630_cov_1.450094_1_plen_148_part_00
MHVLALWELRDSGIDTRDRVGRGPLLLHAQLTKTLLLLLLLLLLCRYHLEDRDANGTRVMRSGERYLDAMYWSMTTMTTIGYGDRSPANAQEILFTVVAEVLGLSFFALLLQQITSLNDVLGLEQVSQKRPVVESPWSQLTSECQRY